MLIHSATRQPGAGADPDTWSSSGERGSGAVGSTPALAPGDAALRIALAPSSFPLPIATPRRPRAARGERRSQILEALGGLLEQPGAERITTAALSARLGSSEAALYRHFASKAQMFEALIELIDRSLFAALDAALEPRADGRAAARATLAALLRYAEQKPGLARVLAGDALAHESLELVERVDRCIGRVESRLGDCLAGVCADAELRASVLVAFAIGRLQRFVRSSFRRRPTEALEPALRLLVP